MSAASKTPTIQLLQADWEITAETSALQDSVRVWTKCHPVLSNTATSEIIELVTRPVWSFITLRDEALSCLLEHCAEKLSQRIVLQSLLPQIIHIINRSWSPDLDEQAAQVVAVAVEKIAHFRRQDVNCVHWWLYKAIKRQIERKELAKRQQQLKEQCLGESEFPDDQLAQTNLPTHLLTTLPDSGTTNLADLIDLVMQRGSSTERQQKS